MNSRRRAFGALSCALSLLLAMQCRADEVATARQPAAGSMLGTKSGQVRDDNGLKMKLAWCPAGIFTMQYVEVVKEPATDDNEALGAADDVAVDEPVPEPRTTTTFIDVRVLLKHGYWFGKYEVTQSEWKTVMATEPWKRQYFTTEGEDFPATWVNWNEAMEFCRKLTRRESQAGRLAAGWEYTLPTEAQWERACRARTESRFSFGDDQSQLAVYGWFFENARNAGEKNPHRVGRKESNPWGLYDMHGNVCEWCRDAFVEKLPGGFDPEVTQQGSARVIRGGGCWSDGERCCSGNRFWRSPAARDFDLGFRVALSPSGNKQPTNSQALP